MPHNALLINYRNIRGEHKKEPPAVRPGAKLGEETAVLCLVVDAARFKVRSGVHGHFKQ
mgnify:CR=1 FL=1